MGRLPALLFAASLAMPTATAAETVSPDAPPALEYQDPLRQQRPASVPADAVLEERGATIGVIEFQILDVFDPENPKENNWLFRLANRLHIRTRKRVIQDRLLFRTGDPYSARELAESERNLRHVGYLYDAKILPVAYENNQVRVRVVTRDVWTLQAGVSFGRSGGENAYRVGLADSNILGFGKGLTLQHSSDVDRTSVLYGYEDPNLGGTWWRMQLAYQDNSDGFLRSINVGRPFYSLDTRWSTGLVALDFDRVDSLYTLGEIRTRFRQVRDFFQLGAGFSRGLVGGSTRRWSAGLTYDRNTFGTAAGNPPSPEQPEDRLLVYPWIGFQYLQDKYATTRNLDKIQRTEDLNLGADVSFRVGWSSTGFGATSNQAVLFSQMHSGFVLGPRQLLFADGYVGGRFGREETQNVLIGGSARYDLRTLGRHDFHVFAGMDIAYNLDGENQLLLGGDSGLRGYPLRYQEGDRRFLVSVEQRFYLPWQVLRLVNVGAAVFFDAGQAWFAGPKGDSSELGLLRDVGFGLRLASARSSRGSMVHVDLAFPLDGDATIDRVQFLVAAKESF